VITNDVNDSYQYVYVIAHIICNHPAYFCIALLNFRIINLELWDAE